jgi:hypothetical protein
MFSYLKFQISFLEPLYILHFIASAKIWGHFLMVDKS